MKWYSAVTSLGVASLASGVATANRRNPVVTLPIVNKVVAPDGISRTATLAGGVYPGPLISGNKGDTFRINVVDQLSDDTMWKSTSVHWHGIHQTKTNYADGTSWVTQCPIAANHSYLYEFSVPNQAGTYWYHSHYAAQYCDGLKGPMVVYDPQDPHKSLYDVDDASTIIALSDWYHKPSKNFLVPGQVPDLADSFNINGKGRWNGSAAGLAAPLSVINVEHGKRYRMRLIQMACEADMVFSIDGHTMTVIEADGTNVEPYLVDSIHIFAGQRYSFILNANQKVGNYWIRSLPYSAYDLNYDFTHGQNSAILRYKTASNSDPTTSQTASTTPLQETALVPLSKEKAPGAPTPGGADVNLNLKIDIDFNIGKYTMNGAAFSAPNVPVLLQILSGTQNAQDLLPKGSVYTLPHNKVVELSIPGTPLALGGPHPMHLHGHDFYVVRSAGSDKLNYDNPIRRDTISTGTEESNTTIRFVTDNSGPWFLHCHIDWHLELGMAVVFAEDTPDTSNDIKPSSDWSQLCPIYSKLTPDQY